ncbi:hypothetical protein BKA64DRAFT_743514 [Cadophora sp. MPI-SDFR-AT-0126]|nr:hypothetical protein BKA64DRAFT_743514 [Leotiomycetes sp. MPI-SDFR-AT-0126]
MAYLADGLGLGGKRIACLRRGWRRRGINSLFLSSSIASATSTSISITTHRFTLSKGTYRSSSFNIPSQSTELVLPNQIDRMPRFILFLRADKQAETSLDGSPEMFAAMATYNESMVAAGIMHSCDGLHPSKSDGRRVIFHPGTDKPNYAPNDGGVKTEVQNGPFPINELVCGWWIIKVPTVEEAVAWAKKCPCMVEGSVIEIRRIADVEDFSDTFDDDLKKREEDLRKKTEEIAKKG